jgi:hypothetical protein
VDDPLVHNYLGRRPRRDHPGVAGTVSHDQRLGLVHHHRRHGFRKFGVAMNDDELREQLVEQITRILASHHLADYGSKCLNCRKELYGEGNGSTLSRHRAEEIVDGLGLVRALKCLV